MSVLVMVKKPTDSQNAVLTQPLFMNFAFKVHIISVKLSALFDSRSDLISWLIPEKQTITISWAFSSVITLPIFFIFPLNFIFSVHQFCFPFCIRSRKFWIVLKCSHHSFKSKQDSLSIELLQTVRQHRLPLTV